MRNEVEERVVGLRFDNNEFAARVKSSMDLLDKLHFKITGLKTMAYSVQVFGQQIKSITFDPLVNGVNMTLGKLMALTAAMTGVSRVASQMFDGVERFVKSVSTDQITAGWSKYSDYTESMQTIMSATKKDEESEADAMARVNEQMQRLLWFTDETSYNLTDMTSNVGKFTSQNIDLETSVTAMEGIALWSAAAGQNAAEASRVMYNMAQALGTGTVQIRDWMSVENANMATAQFKKLAIEAGVAAGTIKKVGSEYRTLAGNVITIQNFRDTLSDDWFTTDSEGVLMRVLNQYGGYAEKVRQWAEENDMLVSEAIEDMKKHGEAANDVIGSSAFESGQAAITFSQAIESTQDAVSTKFMKIFEAIFGNFLRAKTLWTDLANELWEIFAGPLDLLADVFGKFDEMAQMNNIFRDLWGIWNSLLDVLTQIKDTALEAFGFIYNEEDESFDSSIFQKTLNFLNDFQAKFHEFRIEFGHFVKRFLDRDDIWENVSIFFEGLKSALNILKSFVSTILNRVVDPIYKKSNDIFYILSAIIGKIGEGLIWLDDYVQKGDYFNKFFDDIQVIIDKVFESFKKIKEVVEKTLKSLGNAMSKAGIPSYVESALNNTEDTFYFIDILTNGIVEAIDKITEGISIVLPYLIRFWDWFKSSIKDAKTMFSTIGGWISGVIGSILQALDPFINDMTEGLKELKENLNLATIFNEAQTPIDFLNNLLNTFKKFSEDTSTYFNNLFQQKGAVTGFDKVLTLLAWAVETFLDRFEPLMPRIMQMNYMMFRSKSLYETAWKILGMASAIAAGIYIFAAAINVFRAIFGKKTNEEVSEGANQTGNGQIFTGNWIQDLFNLPVNITNLVKTMQGLVNPFNNLAKTIKMLTNKALVVASMGIIISALFNLIGSVLLLAIIPWPKLLLIGGFIIPALGAVIIAIMILLKKMTRDTTQNRANRMVALAGVMAMISGAILQMALALFILGKLSTDELGQASIVMTLLILIVNGIAALMIKLSDSKNDPTQMLAAAGSVAIIAFATILLAKTITKLAKAAEQNKDGFAQATIVVLGLIVLLGIIGILAMQVKLQGNTEKVLIAFGSSAILMAGAILVAAFAMVQISQISQKDLINAGIAMGIIFVALSGFIAGLAGLSKLIANKDNDSTKQFVLLMVLTGIMAAVILVMATALAKIAASGADSDDVIKNASAIAILIGVIGGIIFGMTMLIEKLDQGQIKVLLAVAGSLAGVIGAVGLMALGMAQLAKDVDTDSLWKVVGAILVMVVVVSAVLMLFTAGVALISKSSVGAIVVAILALVGTIMVSMLLAIGLIVYGVGEVLKAFVELANLSDEATTNLRRVMAILAGAISEVLVEIFSGIEEGLSNLFGIKSRLGPTIVEFVFTLFDSILTKLTNSSILGKLKVFLTKLTHTIGAYIKDNHEIIRESLSLMIGDILLLLQEHGPVLIETVDEFLNMMLDNLIALLNTKGSMLIMSLSLLVQMLYNLLVSVRNKLMDLVFGTITMFLLRLQLAALEYGLAAGNIVFTFIDGLLLAINTRAPILMEELALTLILLINALADTIDEHADDIIKSVERLLDSMYNAFLRWVNSGVKIGGKLYNIGYNIIRGVIKGILSGIPLLEYAINNLANTGIVKSFCAKLGIKSPSKVFEGFGINIDQGLGNGMTEGLGKLKGIVSDLASLIMGDFTSSFGDPKSIIAGFMDGIKEGFMGNITSQFNINDLMGDMTNLNPVITPGLDLSNIEGASDKISDMINPGDIDSISQSFTGKMTGMDSVSMKHGIDEMMKKLQNNTKPIDVNVVLDGDAKKMLKVVKVENNKQYKATGVDQLAHA